MTPDDQPRRRTADAVPDSNDPTEIGSAAEDESDTSADEHDAGGEAAFGPPDAPAHDLDPTKPSTAGELGAATSDDPDEIVGSDDPDSAPGDPSRGIGEKT